MSDHTPTPREWPTPPLVQAVAEMEVALVSARNDLRAPRDFDVIVCAECRQTIKLHAPKVSRGSGWICQECAYALARYGTPHPTTSPAA